MGPSLPVPWVRSQGPEGGWKRIWRQAVLQQPRDSTDTPASACCGTAWLCHGSAITIRVFIEHTGRSMESVGMCAGWGWRSDVTESVMDSLGGPGEHNPGRIISCWISLRRFSNPLILTQSSTWSISGEYAPKPLDLTENAFEIGAGVGNRLVLLRWNIQLKAENRRDLPLGYKKKIIWIKHIYLSRRKVYPNILSFRFSKFQNFRKP